MRKQRGFTLIELLICLVMVFVCLFLAYWGIWALGHYVLHSW